MLFAGYGTPRSPEAGFRIGAEGSIPLITNKRGLKITANPSASYDFTSGAPRFGVGLGLNLPSRRQQGGSLPKAQIGDEFLDLSGLADIGMEPFEGTRRTLTFGFTKQIDISTDGGSTSSSSTSWCARISD